LKLIESLVAESPRHSGLLLAAARGFTQYAYAFVQEQADEMKIRTWLAQQLLRDRARTLYLRARDYGLRGLEVRHRGFLAPLSQRFNIDPIHLGIIFLANLEVGYLTPPVGLNLFISSFRFNRPLPEVTRAALPIAAVLLAAVLLITYVPALTTTLPYHLGP
jgi:TRAP transporter T-component/Tripartite ATP-independent periplasmic transporter, DctM component